MWEQGRTGPFVVSGILETDEIRVGSRVGGRVKEVHVAEGDRAAAGTALVTLEPFDLAERLAQARASVAAAQAAYEKLKSGFRREEIEQARARRDRFKATLDELLAGPRPLDLQILRDKLAAASAELVRSQAEYDRVKGLSESERSTKEMFEAVRALEVARAQKEQAKHTLELAEEGTRPEQVAQARANLAEAEQALALVERGYQPEDVIRAAAELESAQAASAILERQTDELTVKAPRDTVVETIDLQPGDLMPANAPMVALVDPARLWVRAYVPQSRAGITVGHKVYLRVDAYPGRTFEAKVTYVSRQAEFAPGNVQTPEERAKLVFRVKAELTEGLDVLRAGMSADVYFDAPP